MNAHASDYPGAVDHGDAFARLCRGDSLAPGLQVSIGNTITTRGLRATLAPDCEIHFLPAIGGG